MRSAQAPDTVILVRASHFTPNVATAADNAFQRGHDPSIASDVSARALSEMDAAAESLKQAGVRVHVFDDDDHTRPDSVFPNNWLSTHPGGYVGIYPMYASNRRHERRGDILELLKSQYRVQTIYDYSGFEPDGIFLEGTGSMVLDHLSRVAYMSVSHRSNEQLLERFCADMNYEPMTFHAVDSEGVPVYHTNVLGCIGTDFALFGLNLIKDAQRRAEVEERLAVNGRTVIPLAESQIRDFAGNAVELRGVTPSGHPCLYLAMSGRAASSLSDDQREMIEQSCQIFVDLPTIELAGGSFRCMVAGVHLDRRVGSESLVSLNVGAIDTHARTADGRDVL